jgi:hypothetical protein
MIDSEGEIIDHELHSPFAYLRSLVDEFSTEKPQECGSEQPLGGALSTCPVGNWPKRNVSVGPIFTKNNRWLILNKCRSSLD